MNLSQKNIKMLMGEEFDSGYALNIKNNDNAKRNDKLLAVSVNKNVLHIGFLDHVPVIENKIKNKTWLHGQLTAVAKVCIGVDINKNGIELLKRKHHIDNVYCVDVLKDELPREFSGIKWDVMILADVIEHVDNPIQFLKAIKNKFGDFNGKIVITTPNAFRLKNFLNLFKGREVINSDHRYWFTPYTLSKIVFLAGLNVTKVELCDHAYVAKRKVFYRLFFKYFNVFRDTLYLECNI